MVNVRIRHFSDVTYDHQLTLSADFLKRFGVPTDQTEVGYAIPPAWQSGLSNGSSAGGILGLLVSLFHRLISPGPLADQGKVNGWAADKYGPKIVMMVSIVALTGFIFIMVFANSLPMLVAGQVLCGIPWGVFQTLVSHLWLLTTEKEGKRKNFADRSDHRLRCRSLSYPAPRIFGGLCQPLLGCWYPSLVRGRHCLSTHRKRLVMEDPIHHPVGVDSTSFHHRLLLSPLPMVARTKRSVRGGQGSNQAIDESQHRI